MMDAKYLAEIKARDSAELPETAAPVFRDRHALLAEVERLNAENKGLAVNGGKYIEIAQKRYEMFEKESKRAEDAEIASDVKDQQIATLKRALELACYELAEALGNSAYQPAVRTLAGGYYNDFIHQAQGQEGKK